MKEKMNIEFFGYKLSICFRTWDYAKNFYKNNFEHLKAWMFGYWNVHIINTWNIAGFRFFGIEVNIENIHD